MTGIETAAAGGGIRRFTGPWTDWRRKRFWILCVFLAYSLIGFYAAPPLIRWIATTAVQETGRSLSVANVRVNPYFLSVRVENAEIRDTDDSVIFAYDEYFVNFQLRSAFERAWTFREVRLAGLYLFEERFSASDTRFVRLFEDLAGDGGTTTAAPAGNPARLVIDHLRLLDGRAEFMDRTVGFDGAFGPISIEVDKLQTIPDRSGQQVVSISTEHGGTVAWRGNIQLVPLRSRGHLTLTGQALVDAIRYADHLLPFDIVKTGVEISLDYDLAFEDGALKLALDDLQANLLGVGVDREDHEHNVLSTTKVSLTNGSLRWPEQVLRLDAIEIEGLELQAGLDPDGNLDLLDLMPNAGGDDHDTDDALPWVVEVGTLRVPGATLNLSDATLSPPAALSLTDLDFDLAGIDIREGTRMPVALTTTLSSGGTVGFRGEVMAFPDPRATGRLSLAGVELNVLQPYVEAYLRIGLRTGQLDLDGELAHGPGQPLDLRGELSVSGLDIADRVQDERLLGWRRLQLDRFELNAADNRLQTSILEFDGLFGRVHIAEDLSTNLGELVVEQAPGAKPATPPEIQLGGVQLDDGALDFSDFSLPLPFRAGIRKLNGNISTLSTDSSEPATVTLEGQVNEYGLARITGDIDPWAPTQRTAIDLTFRNLDLSRLTPYTIQFAGYAIDDGRMDLDLGYRLQQRLLKGENNIVIREIKLGEKVDHPDAGSLPLGLAVALLTDSEGVIDVDVPVEGDLDDPEFRIGGVVWRAIGNLITKLVTAPFRFLGNLVGIDSKDFGTLRFNPAEADVSPPDKEQLIKLGEALLQRPELTIEVNGTYDARIDGPALAAQALQARFEERAALLPIGEDELSTDHERRVLEALFAEQLPGAQLEAIRTEHTATAEAGAERVLDTPAYVAALRARLEAAQPIGEAQLTALAQARAESVLATLLASQPDAGLKAAAGTVEAVSSDDPKVVPMELAVSAGE